MPERLQATTRRIPITVDTAAAQGDLRPLLQLLLGLARRDRSAGPALCAASCAPSPAAEDPVRELAGAAGTSGHGARGGAGGKVKSGAGRA